MIDFHLLITNSFFIFGMHYLLGQNKTPLSFIGFQLEVYLPEWLAKPILTCPICMSSVYGSLFYWLSGKEINIDTIIQWLVYIVVLAGLNKLLLTFNQ